MSGHGWVKPLPGGAKARCGGPAICSECALEARQAGVDPLARVYEEALAKRVDRAKALTAQAAKIAAELVTAAQELAAIVDQMERKS